MGFFSAISKSAKKSKKLRKLQLIISPPDQTIEDLASNFMSNLTSGKDEKGDALEEFLDLCEDDDGVVKIMAQYNLKRDDLKEIYKKLIAIGLGQWIKGHYAALSTIAYYEPLLFVVESERRGVPFMEVVGGLLEYWDGRIKQGGLLQSLQ